MKRYNLFHRIHKGLRALLYDTSMLLQRTDFTIQEEAGEAVGRLQFVLALFEKYQYSEDLYVLPAMTAYEPSVADSFERDHEEAYQLAKKLSDLINDFNRVKLPLEKVAVSNAVVGAFEEFTLFTILHMTKEEQFVNKMLWRYYTDAELQKIAWKIVSEAEPDFTTPYTRWIVRGMNNNEIVRWLKEIRTTAAEDVFQAVLKTAETELQPRRWHLLQDVLTTGALVA
jgi:hypothetical protein